MSRQNAKRKEKPQLHVFGSLHLPTEILPWERDLLVPALKSLLAEPPTDEPPSSADSREA